MQRKLFVRMMTERDDRGTANEHIVKIIARVPLKSFGKIRFGDALPRPAVSVDASTTTPTIRPSFVKPTMTGTDPP